MTVISALLAGAEYIEDIDVLRAGGSEMVFGHEVRAPSTIGAWLRVFTWGSCPPARRRRRRHPRRRMTGPWRPGRDEPVVIDLGLDVLPDVRQAGRLEGSTATVPAATIRWSR